MTKLQRLKAAKPRLPHQQRRVERENRKLDRDIAIAYGEMLRRAALHNVARRAFAPEAPALVH